VSIWARWFVVWVHDDLEDTTMATSPWPTIHAERAALVDDLRTLTEVSGPLLSIVMAITGRHQVLDDLEGPGVAILHSRP